MSKSDPSPLKATGDSERPRAREHTEQRFAPTQHQFDLRAVARELASEPASRGGHRQRALYRHGRLTVALFTFEAGGGLPDHVANGVVTIHVVDGQLRVTSSGVEQTMGAGGLLVLAPGVRHDVLADQPSIMLLQVYLEDSSAGRTASR